MGFQVYKDANLIKIYPRVCPHEGGDLDINSPIGVRYTINDFIKKDCRMRCNIHNRMFDPIVTINLDDDKKEYKSNMYSFLFKDNKIYVKIREDVNLKNEIDWSK